MKGMSETTKVVLILVGFVYGACFAFRLWLWLAWRI